jgi:hypothetical protein
MSNRQLGWDEMRVRDRIDPRDVAQDEHAQAAEQEARDNMPLENNKDEDNWIPPGNADQGSRKK